METNKKQVGRTVTGILAAVIFFFSTIFTAVDWFSYTEEIRLFWPAFMMLLLTVSTFIFALGKRIPAAIFMFMVALVDIIILANNGTFEMIGYAEGTLVVHLICTIGVLIGYIVTGVAMLVPKVKGLAWILAAFYFLSVVTQLIYIMEMLGGFYDEYEMATVIGEVLLSGAFLIIAYFLLALSSTLSRANSAPARQAQPNNAPAYAQPVYGQPTYGQPAYAQPAYNQPQYGQPQYTPYAQPAYNQPNPQQGPRPVAYDQFTGRPIYGYDQNGQPQYTPYAQPVNNQPAYAAPVAVAEEAPADVVEEAPAEVVEEAPAEVVEEAPAEAVEEAPAEVVEEAPAEAVEEAPAYAAEAAPVYEVVEEVPAEAVEETPAETAEEKPAEVVEEAPAEAVEEAPAEAVEEAPAEAVEEAPAEAVEETPVAVTEEAPAVAVEEAPVETSEEKPAETAEKKPAKKAKEKKESKLSGAAAAAFNSAANAADAAYVYEAPKPKDAKKEKITLNKDSVRNLLKVAILALVTGIIYRLYWIYKTTIMLNECDTNSRKRDPLMTVVYSFLVPFYGAIWMYKTIKALEVNEELENEEFKSNAFLTALFDAIMPTISILYAQNKINEMIEGTMERQEVDLKPCEGSPFKAFILSFLTGGILGIFWTLKVAKAIQNTKGFVLSPIVWAILGVILPPANMLFALQVAKVLESRGAPDCKLLAIASGMMPSLHIAFLQERITIESLENRL